MQRTLVFITLFAVAVATVTGVSAWFTWRRVAGALATDFERAVERVAATAAREIGPADAAEARRDAGGPAYLEALLVLTNLRAATGVADAALLDSAGVTVVDARAPDQAEGSASPLDSLAHPALARALAGESLVSGTYVRGGEPRRAALAPVRDDDGRVRGVVAVEARPAYRPVVAQLGRTLLLIALLTVLAIALLAALVVRGAWSAARLERRLSRAETLAAMGRLTATLAHEIKNPLAIIRGSAQRLGRLEPEAQRMAGFVVEESDRLSRTLARYLEFARGGASGTSATGHGDAAAALAATLDLLEGELGARRVRLERGPWLETAPVALDDESLKQLYLNLILNALDAMPDGGRLGVGLAEHGRHVVVRIEDDGAGIPAEVLDRVGSPFFTTKTTGSGLGLFLARRLAEGAGGTLRIRSGGQGTRCELRFPRARA